MSAVFINPQLYVQKNDKFTTGIVYMPIALAYVVSFFKNNGIAVEVKDLFGQNPKKSKLFQDKIILGDDINTLKFNNKNEIKCFFVYANQVANHNSIKNIVSYLKENYVGIPVVILENSQAVTAYSLDVVQENFFSFGSDYLVVGDLEHTAFELYHNLDNKDKLKLVNGLISKDFKNSKINFVNELDELPIPAWENFPIENYWDLGYSHGPLSSKRYLPILTSRGCPYPCKFCVVPKTNERRWRSRSAKNLVKEIQYLKRKFLVNEFHLEDLNPTVNEKRTNEICEEFIKEKINITWKIVSGTKVESIKSLDTIDKMYDAGCRYISISPESGSKELMKEIDKPFDYDHALKIVKRMNEVKIFGQACFILGFPGETNQDIKKTRKMVFDLTRKGIDEIAVFIITPIPGSRIFDKFTKLENLSNLTFTPTWRDDYKLLNRERLLLYVIFLTTKLIFHPIKIFKQALNFFSKNFQTKMEMVPYKFLKITKFQYVSKKNN